MQSVHPQKGIPAAVGRIRNAHENDTADELTLCEAVATRSQLVARVEADRRITWAEWTQLRKLDDRIEHYALKSLNNNRTINALYGGLYRGTVCDADLRTLCPSIGELTVGDLIAAGDWLDAA